ncbi:MAG: hypothetical protein ABUL61_00990, partial [Oleiharenicola lentus]
MAGQRQDYILRQIELLRKFVAQVVGSSDGGGLEQALQLSFNLQEKLFAQPAAEFLQQPVDGQIASLMAGESKVTGHAKCLTYVELLQQTARLYQFRDRSDLATGARQLALQVALHVALAEPADPAAVRLLVTELLAAVDPLDLLPPVRELL